MKFVILETPYAGDVERNVEYARECMLDSLNRNEAPFASHLLYTQVLDDTNPEQRRKGIEAGLWIAKHAVATVVYTDYGLTNGMLTGMDHAKKHDRPIEFRQIYRRLQH